MLSAALAPDEAFRALIRQHRLRADLSQGALARHAGVNRSLVSLLERGLRRRPPPRDVIHRLAAALDLSGPDEDRLLALAGHAPLWLMALARAV